MGVRSSESGGWVYMVINLRSTPFRTLETELAQSDGEYKDLESARCKAHLVDSRMPRRTFKIEKI